jgi:hypothetical protein
MSGLRLVGEVVEDVEPVRTFGKLESTAVDHPTDLCRSKAWRPIDVLFAQKYWGCTAPRLMSYGVLTERLPSTPDDVVDSVPACPSSRRSFDAACGAVVVKTCGIWAQALQFCSIHGEFPLLYTAVSVTRPDSARYLIPRLRKLRQPTCLSSPKVETRPPLVTSVAVISLDFGGPSLLRVAVECERARLCSIELSERVWTAHKLRSGSKHSIERSVELCVGALMDATVYS